MEMDIKKLPEIPDNKLFYILVVSFYDCYDQLYSNPKFIVDVELTLDSMIESIRRWRMENLAWI